MRNAKGLLLAIGVMTAFAANAQFKFGAAAGLNVSKFSANEEAVANNVLGYNIGLITEYKLPVKIGIEVDFLYSVKGSSMDIEDAANAIKNSKYMLSYIDIPAVAKLYILKVTNLQAGFQYSHLMSAKVESEDVKEQFKSGDLALVVGAGVDVSKFHLSARYNLGVIKVFDDVDARNNMLTFSVGYWLKK